MAMRSRDASMSRLDCCTNKRLFRRVSRYLENCHFGGAAFVRAGHFTGASRWKKPLNRKKTFATSSFTNGIASSHDLSCARKSAIGFSHRLPRARYQIER